MAGVSLAKSDGADVDLTGFLNAPSVYRHGQDRYYSGVKFLAMPTPFYLRPYNFLTRSLAPLNNTL